MNDRLEIEIISEYEGQLPVELNGVVSQALSAAAVYEGVGAAEVAVVFLDDEQIHELNRKFRNVDRPTDVLSFPMREGLDVEPEIVVEEDAADAVEILGDIVISIDTAARQAREYDHSIEREIGFLAVHGFLHLLGYDHETPDEEREMFRRQEEILGQVGLPRR